MSVNRGFEWQVLFKKICEQSRVDCLRFYDPTQRFKNVDNPADFVISRSSDDSAILVELKSVNSKSWRLDFRQYERLCQLVRFKSYVILWFVQLKEVWALDIREITKLKELEFKSVTPKKLQETNCFRLDLAWGTIKPKNLNLDILWR